MKNVLRLIVASGLFCSCSSTNQMSLSVQNPAPVSIPAKIKTVALVNRSRAGNESTTLDAIHRVLSLESKDLQAQGSYASLDGLRASLSQNPRFTEVKSLDKLDLRSFGAGVFPAPMAWDSVQKICNDNGIDAIFSLELFDAESKLNYAAEKGTVQVGNTSIPLLNHYVGMNTLVKTGWRIYDPSTRTVLDEYVLNREIAAGGQGINPAVAASVLMGKKEAVKIVGNDAGQAYAGRVLPYWVRVSRSYFSSGNDRLKTANRKALSGNWDGAGELWLQETKDADKTAAGRACYNMAIIAEINGDLDGAIQWAQKSYEDYKVRMALDYLSILRNRKTKNEVLENQQTAFSPR